MNFLKINNSRTEGPILIFKNGDCGARLSLLGDLCWNFDKIIANLQILENSTNTKESPNKNRKLSIPSINLYNRYKARTILNKKSEIEFFRKIKNKRVIYEDA